jgi:hypothetical protein
MASVAHPFCAAHVAKMSVGATDPAEALADRRRAQVTLFIAAKIVSGVLIGSWFFFAD